MITLRRPAAILVLSIAVGACNDNGSGSTAPPKLASCSPAASIAFERMAASGVSAAAGTLVPLQGATASAAELPSCLQLVADGGTYLIVPQFAADTGPFTGVGYALSSQANGTLGSLQHMTVPTPRARTASVQMHFDALLRRGDHRMAMRLQPSSNPPIRANVVQAQTVAVPDSGSTRDFVVLSNLDGTTSDTAHATLEYIGTNILVYVDTAAPANGFSSAQLKAFGDLFDKTLFDIDVSHFGAPSDIDNNGHVIVLMTPIINHITPDSTCQSNGFVAGFFYGGDLLPTQAQQQGFVSNGAEVFYAIVPDPNGQFSCAHTVDQLESITPATFLHEFQHMISFNQHVLVRNGPDEVPWLNEGMSHIAESLGALYYMNKFPPPSGRTDPSQLFPDSAEGFISGDLFNSYAYLLNPTSLTDTSSVVHWAGDGTLPQRGAAWLFLRWLGDQKGPAIYKSLEQTALTGVANVEAQSGESLPSLFGDFSLAVYTDSLPGVPRDQIANRFKFPGELSLRAIYARIFQTSGPSQTLPLPFPITVTDIPPMSAADSLMLPGTMSFYSVTTSQSGSPLQLFFTDPAGNPLSTNLAAQVSVFRCPSAQACPSVVTR